MRVIYEWERWETEQLSHNFYTSEFACPTDATQRVDYDLIRKLQNVRTKLGMPITVTSGYRTVEYNKYLRGLGYATAKRSQHLLGRAADITCRDMDRLLELCRGEFMAIGIGQTFIHVDLRDDKEREWTY